MSAVALFLTEFADAAVMAPVTLVVTLTLLVFAQYRAAAIWALMTGSVCLLMLGLKFGGVLCADLSCALPPESLHLVSPSGHVAASAAIYGGLLGLSLRSAGRPLLVSCSAAVVVAVIVGLTRVALDEHSLAEVIVGGCVGVVGAAAFVRAAPTWPSFPRWMVLFGAVVFAAGIFHGSHADWETRIRAASASAAQLLSDAR